MSDEPLSAEHEAAIRARLAAITPPPWHWDTSDPKWNHLANDTFHSVLFSLGVLENNAHFIAAAPDDVRVLLAEIERLRAELADCKVDQANYQKL